MSKFDDPIFYQCSPIGESNDPPSLVIYYTKNDQGIPEIGLVVHHPYHKTRDGIIERITDSDLPLWTMDFIDPSCMEYLFPAEHYRAALTAEHSVVPEEISDRRITDDVSIIQMAGVELPLLLGELHSAALITENDVLGAMQHFGQTPSALKTGSAMKAAADFAQSR